MNPYKTDRNPNLEYIVKNTKVNFNINTKKILPILEKSFFTKIGVLNNHGFYEIQGSNIKAKIHPDSVLFL